jgi:uncharacterized protein involved in exopolysaccharide biosynthesis
MASVQNGAYEILLRFNCEKGEAFGHLRTVQRAVKSYLVDDTGIITGKIDGGADDHPTDIAVDELTKYLGGQFVTFNHQLEVERAGTAAAKEAGDNLRASLNSTTSELDAIRKSHDELETAHADVSDQLKETAAQLAAANSQIESLARAVE